MVESARANGRWHWRRSAVSRHENVVTSWSSHYKQRAAGLIE